MNLEVRPCRSCLRTFKCITTSKQEFCSKHCDLDFVRNSGNEEKWKQKKKELKKLEHSQFVLGSMVERQNKLREETKYAKRVTVKGTQMIWSSDKKNLQEEKIKKKENVITKDTVKEKTKNEQKEIGEKLQMIQNTETENQNTKQNIIRNINPIIKSEPKSIVEKETHSSESKQQLTLVKEVISTQLNYLDKSAELIMQRMEQLNKSKYNSDETEVIQQPSMVAIDQTIQLARVMNDLMRTKKDALKTIHDMVVGK